MTIDHCAKDKILSSNKKKKLINKSFKKVKIDIKIKFVLLINFKLKVENKNINIYQDKIIKP